MSIPGRSYKFLTKSNLKKQIFTLLSAERERLLFTESITITVKNLLQFPLAEIIKYPLAGEQSLYV